MTQEKKSINSHIEEYLNYYCNLADAPGFAVLLKGQWGAGKTWFIEQYCEKLKTSKSPHKHLYVSLYGMTSFSDIEEAFFQQLHPILSSKGMAITGKILKGLLKASIKFDIDNDGREDGSWNMQIPEIPDYLNDVDKRILIFDDLERCKIDLKDVFGYINQFVEHQNLKVILIANEIELQNKNPDYKVIKEKLVGKTFDVFTDFECALKKFSTETGNSDLGVFLEKNTDFIKDIYIKTDYANLRTLKQITLDFKRISEFLPDKAKNKPEVLKEILKTLILFSVEIKRGVICSSDLIGLLDRYISKRVSKMLNHDSNIKKPSDSSKVEDDENIDLAQKMLTSYSIFELHKMLPSPKWWQAFFDKGIVQVEELEKAVLSEYFPEDQAIPDWRRLYYFHKISDSDFERLLKKVESEYNERKFFEIGEIKHIFGIFLTLSDKELYCKSKEDILRDSKSYIDDLRVRNQIRSLSYSKPDSFSKDNYDNLMFQGFELSEFNDFDSYIHEVQDSLRINNLPNDAKDLLAIMKTDPWKFRKMVCLSQTLEQIYFSVPIIKYIETDSFLESLLSMKFEEQQAVFWALKERYEIFIDMNKELISELEWLKELQGKLLEQAKSKKGKLSGYLLSSLNEAYLSKIITGLEAAKSQYSSQV
jgi:hypothetical protein